jgi:hypothetical protein
MRALRNAIFTAMIFLPLSVALVAPASAATGAASSAALVARPAVTYAPFPSCGDHFTFRRSGVDVRIVGVDLEAFLPSDDPYGLVYVSANNKGFSSPYNASRYSGASFEINTGSKSQTTISISLTNDTDTATLCSQDYYA